MVAKRIITTLMLNNGILFRSKKFIPDYRYTLNFIDMWSVDELVILDITGPLSSYFNSMSNSSLPEACFVLAYPLI